MAGVINFVQMSLSLSVFLLIVIAVGLNDVEQATTGAARNQEWPLPLLLGSLHQRQCARSSCLSQDHAVTSVEILIAM
jgi:hypothetical protein